MAHDVFHVTWDVVMAHYVFLCYMGCCYSSLCFFYVTCHFARVHCVFMLHGMLLWLIMSFHVTWNVVMAHYVFSCYMGCCYSSLCFFMLHVMLLGGVHCVFYVTWDVAIADYVVSILHVLLLWLIMFFLCYMG